MARTSRKISRVKQSAKYKYNKRKPSGSKKKAFKRKFNKLKRKSTEGYVTPRRVRARTGSLPTPPSTGRRALHLTRDIASAGAGALYGAPAAIGTELAFRAGEGLYDQLTQTESRSGNSKVTYVNGQMSGKYQSVGKPVSRKRIGKKGGLSKFGMAQKGITYREEYRDPAPIVTTTESQIIAHTSLPEKATYYNLWRAVLKTLFVKGGAVVDSLTNATGMVTAGTQIKLKWYPSVTAVGLEIWTYNIDPAYATTWQKLFDDVADSFLTGATDIYASNVNMIRWVEMELVPNSTFSTSSYNRVRMTLQYLNVDVRSKSCLKLQNQSGRWAETDPEHDGPPTIDDVNAIPVECNMYYATGNNLVHMNRREMLSNGYGDLGKYQTFAQNDKGAEPAPAYEYINCTGKDKFIIDPGHIKTSIISHRKVYKFGEILNLLIRRAASVVGGASVTYANAFVSNVYQPTLGHIRALHIDRVIGAKTGSVRIVTEFELYQQIACYGPENTATDQYEVQRPV